MQLYSSCGDIASIYCSYENLLKYKPNTLICNLKCKWKLHQKRCVCHQKYFPKIIFETSSQTSQRCSTLKSRHHVCSTSAMIIVGSKMIKQMYLVISN